MRRTAVVTAAAACSTLAACALTPADDEFETVQPSEQESIAALTFVGGTHSCSERQREALAYAHNAAYYARFSPEFEVCIDRFVRTQQYQQCNQDPQVVGELGAHSQAHADLIKDVAQRPNSLRLSCDANLGAGALVTPADAHDPSYDGTSRVHISDAFLADNDVGVLRRDPYATAVLASLLWHERTHTFGYKHNQAAPHHIDCGYNEHEDGRSSNVPDGVAACVMGAIMANQAVAYADYTGNGYFLDADIDRQVFSAGVYRRSRGHIELDDLRHIVLGHGVEFRACDREPEAPGQPVCVAYRRHDPWPDSQLLGDLAGKVAYLEVRPIAVGYEREFVDSDGPSEPFTQFASYSDRRPQFELFQSLGRNRLNALLLGAGMRARACDDSRGIAPCSWHYGSVSTFRPIMGFNRGSFVATSPAVTVFDQPNFVGGRWTVPAGTYTAAHLADADVGDNSIASIIVPPGFKARVCDQSNGGGPCRAFANSVRDVDDMRDVISRLQVIRSCGDGVVDPVEYCDAGFFNGLAGVCNDTCSGITAFDPGDISLGGFGWF